MVHDYHEFCDMKRKWKKNFSHKSEIITINDVDEEYITLDASEYIDLLEIGEEAGQTFTYDSPGICANHLQQMQNLGFNIPQYAIDALREEQMEIYKEEQEQKND